VTRELRSLDHRDHRARCVRAVAADLPDEDTVDARSRAHDPDERHVTAVLARERRVIEPDDVGAQFPHAPIISRNHSKLRARHA
jgi:hypothetical protein